MVSIGTVVIQTADVRRAAEFWAEALGYVTRDGHNDDDSVMLVPEDGNGPNLTFDRSDRTHLDLYASADEQQAEVERLISLGAKRVEDWPYPEGADFIVLADPVGNLFCVVDTGQG